MSCDMLIFGCRNSRFAICSVKEISPPGPQGGVMVRLLGEARS